MARPGAEDRAQRANRIREFYGCYWFEEYAPSHMLDKLPVDNILFETDYPHPVCLDGHVREKIDAGLAGVKPELRRKLLFDNAAKLYKVEAPPARRV